jgi:nicotinamidase/pyrazinamidase
LKRKLSLDITNKDALIVTDIQMDFLPGGALPVPEGDLVIPVLNDYIKMFKEAKGKIIASRDWHPSNHMSFVAQGGQWQPHCVQNSEGSKFSPALKLPETVIVVSKATDPKKEAYSVFDGTDLVDELKAHTIQRILIGGLAADYCVLNSVLDARKMGMETYVLVDATKGLNVKPGDVDRAFETMNQRGAKIVTLTDFPEPEPLKGEESLEEIVGDKPLGKVDIKKKARMKAKGAYDRVRRERG